MDKALLKELDKGFTFVNPKCSGLIKGKENNVKASDYTYPCFSFLLTGLPLFKHKYPKEAIEQIVLNIKPEIEIDWISYRKYLGLLRKQGIIPENIALSITDDTSDVKVIITFNPNDFTAQKLYGILTFVRAPLEQGNYQAGVLSLMEAGYGFWGSFLFNALVFGPNSIGHNTLNMIGCSGLSPNVLNSLNTWEVDAFGLFCLKRFMIDNIITISSQEKIVLPLLESKVWGFHQALFGTTNDIWAKNQPKPTYYGSGTLSYSNHTQDLLLNLCKEVLTEAFEKIIQTAQSIEEYDKRVKKIMDKRVKE